MKKFLVKFLIISLMGFKYILIFFFLRGVFYKTIGFNGWNQVIENLDFIRKFHFEFMSYLIPSFEILIVFFLLIKRTSLLGVYCATLTILIYSLFLYYKIYITHDTCSCMGVVKGLSLEWNLIFMLISIILCLCYILLIRKFDKAVIERFPHD